MLVPFCSYNSPPEAKKVHTALDAQKLLEEASPCRVVAKLGSLQGKPENNMGNGKTHGS